MKRADAALRDIPRDFRVDEIFFSTTDLRGVITAGNGVFVRISGYSAAHLIGRAHNIIRHPHMPRAAFRMVWSYLQHSRRTAALVKNLAHDGCYYWVVALFVPCPGGYLSIRFKPTSPLVDGIADTYAEMLAEEERQLAAGASEAAAMDASTALLIAALRERGFADYDTFMRSLLCEELKSRDEVLAHVGCAIVQPLPAEAGGDGIREQLRALYRSGVGAYSQLNRLFLRLDEFVALQKSLDGQAAFVGDLTRELRLAALNASLAATRAGSDGESLGVVSHHMGHASTDVANAVGLLTSGIRTVAKRLRSVIFNLAAGRLQIEMIMAFLHELIVARPENGENRVSPSSINALQHAFRFSLERASSSLDDLEGATRELNPVAQKLGRHMLELQVAQLSGMVETTRLGEQGDFNAVFSHIRRLTDDTRQQLTGLAQALGQLDALAVETPAATRDIAALAVEMETAAATLAVAG